MATETDQVVAQAEGSSTGSGTPAGDAHGAAETATGEAQGAVADTHATTEADGHQSGVFPPFDSSTYPSQLLWLVLTFVAFYFLMKKVALPRIAGILEDRRDRVAGDLDQAERMREQSEAALAGYEQALAEARGRANAIAETARGEAKAAADAQQAKTEAELADKLAAAEKRIGEIKAEALAEVGNIATETAEAVIESLYGAKVDRKDVASAIESVMGR